MWLPIPGLAGYEAHPSGLIRSIDRLDKAGHRRRGRILKQYKVGKGYLGVSTPDGCKQTSWLIALTFIGPRPKGFGVLHKDGNRHNNTVENLYYGTQADNAQDAIRHGTFRGYHKKLRADPLSEIGPALMKGITVEQST